MDDRRWYLVILSVTLLSGCAQTQFRAGELPAQYAAQSIRDFSSVDLTPYATAQSASELLRSGDQLEVRLDTGAPTEEASLAWTVGVDEEGVVDLPGIGPVKLAGLSKPAAEKRVVQASLERDVFLTPTVDISVGDREKRTVYVQGAVASPGPIEVFGEKVSLADVIVRAGGFTSDANGQISVSSAIVGHSPGGDVQAVSSTAGSVAAVQVSLTSTPLERFQQIPILDGSMVTVESREPRPIQVSGVIRNQAVEVPSGQNVRLLDAITLAGGQTYSNWISDRVTVIRRVPGRNETVRIRGSIRGAKSDDAENILLAPYDIVNVEENLLTFTLSTLSGLFGAGVSAAQIGAL